MPSVSLFGLAGNFLSIYILHHREVKLKKDFVDVLCMLATFDNLLLVTTFFLFSLPTLSVTWENQVSLFVLFVFILRTHVLSMIRNVNILCILKVSNFQNEFMMSSFLPKYEQKIVKISALTTQGRYPDNF